MMLVMKQKDYIFDNYAKKAKSRGFRSRAAFKLIEMNQQIGFLKPGMTVLDMGAAPGGWSQVAHDIVGPTGKVVGIDLLAIEPYKNIHFIKGNFHTDLPNMPFDLIISDICPNKTGNLFVDQCNMIDICQQMLDIISSKKVQYNGNKRLICKFFHGEQEKDFNQQLLEVFKSVKKLKPQSSRQQSGEFYYWCWD